MFLIYRICRRLYYTSAFSPAAYAAYTSLPPMLSTPRQIARSALRHAARRRATSCCYSTAGTLAHVLRLPGDATSLRDTCASRWSKMINRLCYRYRYSIPIFWSRKVADVREDVDAQGNRRRGDFFMRYFTYAYDAL